jgi:hypothetical protein
VRVTWGPASIIAAIYAAASFLLPVIDDLADDPTLAGVPPWAWVVASVAATSALIIGRMLQRARDVQKPVSWGVSSVLGYVAALAAVVAPFLGELASDERLIGLHPAVWPILSAVLVVVTTLGRMDQASRLDPALQAELRGNTGGTPAYHVPSGYTVTPVGDRQDVTVGTYEPTDAEAAEPSPEDLAAAYAREHDAG